VGFTVLISILNGGFFEKCFYGQGYSWRGCRPFPREDINILVPTGIEPGISNIIDQCRHA